LQNKKTLKNYSLMKKNLFFTMFAFAGMSIAMYSCGGSSEPQKAEEVVVKEEPVVVAQESNELGKKIYNEKCIVCHMANGEGVPGAFPSLVGSEYLLTNKVGAIAQALNGAPGGSTIKGIKYSAPMPPQVDTKEEAVAVINYVLNQWGNNGGTVTLEDAKDIVINPR
jgi:mono/diheme cytochrome c family protein